MERRITVPNLRAAWWAYRALGQARRTLRRDGFEGVALSAPPSLPDSATRGVLAALRRQPSTCLERALVLQRWYAAQGSPRDVVIAVKGPSRQFEAHAWLDGEHDAGAETFSELMRLPA